MKGRGMKKHVIAIAMGALSAAGVVQAGSYSITPTIATDYDFRGVSMTDPVKQEGKPAFQVGGTYNFDPGLYVGAWGSNVDNSFVAPDGSGLDGDNVEIDFFTGYAWGDASTDFAYDVGLNLYTYPGLSDFTTLEAFVGVSRNFYSAKLWYTPDHEVSDKGGLYAELNANFPLGNVDGLTLVAHVGRTVGAAYDDATDYSIGTAYNIGTLRFAVRYVDRDKGIRSRIVGSVSTTLPWN
jgi:uncharacterized protein (TIGR02001 family)